MAVTYADVYIDYYAGRNIDAKGVRTSQGYTWWERNLPDSYLLKELNSMINDSDRDNNYLLLPEDTILEERYAWKKLRLLRQARQRQVASDAICWNRSVRSDIRNKICKHKINHTPIA